MHKWCTFDRKNERLRKDFLTRRNELQQYHKSAKKVELITRSEYGPPPWHFLHFGDIPPISEPHTRRHNLVTEQYRYNNPYPNSYHIFGDYEDQDGRLYDVVSAHEKQFWCKLKKGIDPPVDNAIYNLIIKRKRLPRGRKGHPALPDDAPLKMTLRAHRVLFRDNKRSGAVWFD